MSSIAGKNHLSRSPYRFFNADRVIPSAPDDEPSFEFDESDVWNSQSLPPAQSRPETKKARPASKKASRKTENSSGRTAQAASSLPMSIPDWSKIVGESKRGEILGGDCSDEEDARIPPHEFLAKQYERMRIASFSVHEGIGRTLKGRDLSRVRNTIWEKTGFQD